MSKKILLILSDRDEEVINFIKEKHHLPSLTSTVRYAVHKFYEAETGGQAITNSVFGRGVVLSDHSSSGRPPLSRTKLKNFLLTSDIVVANLKAEELKIFPTDDYKVQPTPSMGIMYEGSKGVLYKYSFVDKPDGRYVRTAWVHAETGEPDMSDLISKEGEPGSNPWIDELAETFLKRKIKQLGL